MKIGKSLTLKKLLFFSLLFIQMNGYSQKKETVARTSAGPDVQKIIQEAYDSFKSNSDGKNANYIPFLDKVDSKLYGIAVVTPDGKVFEIGDTKYEFGIESISKVFTLCMAMTAIGPNEIPKKIGANATGAAFNSITAIELEGKRPVNPFVNAGAMATTSLVTKDIKGDNQKKWEALATYYDRFAGRKLSVLEELYKSEAETNQHNQAIAILLQSYNYIYDDPLVACDVYTRQCSVGVSARDLAIMAGTLANGGVNPVTKDRLLETAYIPKVLAIMGTAGLYETTGEWMYKVGVPSKSGVGGGIISVIPGRYGIAVFSPPLDKAGNSVKAQLAIEYIAGKLNGDVYAAK